MRDREGVLFHRRGEVLFFHRQLGRGRRIGFHPFGGLEQRAGGGCAGLWIAGEKPAVRQHRAAILIPVRRIRRLVSDVADLAIGDQQTADRLGVGNRVHLAFVQGQPEFAGRKHEPTDLFTRVNAVGTQNAIGKDERRCSHSGHADSLVPQILCRMNGAFRRGLDAQAAAMDAAGEFHVQSLFDRLEKIHDQVMRHVEPAQRQHILVIGPLAFDERDLQAFFLEETFLHRREYRRLAGQADVADTDFRLAAAGNLRASPAAGQEEHC